MFGDYIGVSVVQGNAVTVVATATAPTDHLFNEPMVALPGGLPVTGGSSAAQASPGAGLAAPGRASRTATPTAL